MDRIGELLLHSGRDLILVCAHRGLHGTLVRTNIHIPEIRDAPENSRAAIAPQRTRTSNAWKLISAQPIGET
ncbi:hypothetical protein ACFFWD_15885 [Bradyrhizobium erythrophlei]|uniref:hypothetical protein n=1 Tax=Bradyrhizobium erythrophlei TaxID=1437360 RepID=UPI0035EC0DD4